MKHCPEPENDCGYRSVEDIFCPHHGKRLIDYPKCFQCGVELYLTGDFCQNCGTKRPDNQDRGK